MDTRKSLFQKACGILCFLCVCILHSSAQTELLITYNDQTTETFSIAENGKLTFSQTELIIDDGVETPIEILIAEIRKINVSQKNDVSIIENVITEQSDLVLYPNPAGNYIYLKSSGSEKYPVIIYSITGQKILEGNFTSDEQIDISHLPSGLYIVKTDKQTLKFSKL